MKKHLLFLTLIMFVLVMIIPSFTSCIKIEAITPDGNNQPPSVVINIYPVLSELVDENNFYAKWTKSLDPEGQEITYVIHLSKNKDELDGPQYFETKGNTMLMPNLTEGVWYWKVTAKDPGGNKTPSPIWNFTVNGDSLPQPVNPEELPPDPVLIVTQVENTSFTLDWPAYEDKQNPANIVQYTINIYENENLSNIRNEQERYLLLSRTVPVTTVHTTDTIHIFRNMKSQTYYDWVIIAQTNANQTSMVGSSGVKTGNSPPYST